MTEPKDQKKDECIGAVLVVGGGVGGVQASLDLADAGYFVYLVEHSPAIGGVMAQLDKTFPTNDCSMCILSPKLVERGRHLNIEIITNARIKGISGEPGNFKVSVLKKPSYVDPEKCVACGACVERCPSKVEDAFNEGFSTRKAIYIPYPQAVPHVYHIDPIHCRYLTRGKCQLCVKMCQRNAIDFEMKEEVRELSVGAVVLAPGFDEYNALRKHPFGYGRYANVITSIQFERLISQVKGMNLVELENTKENCQCCGVSAWLGCTTESKAPLVNKLDEAEKTAAATLLTTCTKCLAHLSCVLNEKPPLKEFQIKVQDLTTFLAEKLT
jgi:heterodisulfide reductase subunit A